MTDENPYEAFIESYTKDSTPTEDYGGTDEARAGEWRNVWVWVGRIRDEVFPASLELLGKAREIADQLGARVGAVVFGHELEKSVPKILARYGADVVYTADAPRFAHFQIDTVREALVYLVEAKRPEILLFAATVQGRNLAAQVAARLRTGIVPNCVQLTVDTTDRLLIHTQTSYENRLVADLVTREARPQIATVTPGAFRQPTPDDSRPARHQDVTEDVPVAEPRTRVKEEAPEPERPLERYDVVLAGGLGLGSADAWNDLKRLGELTEAAVVGTRAAIACGWCPPEKLLSREIQRIHPRLYVAFGVVGEYDHLKAVEQADLIIAVTDDANAPICEMADFIALGDTPAILADTLKRISEGQVERVVLPTQPAQ
jgi:electron transfer flavoprotein alpha subunit